MPRLLGDSADYRALEEAAKRTRDLPGLSIEIGLRLGGGTSVILEHSPPGSTHIAVDPYGDVCYSFSEDVKTRGWYLNRMRDDAVPSVYKLAREFGVNFLFFNMEDSEFFYRFRGNVPVYQHGKKMLCSVYRLMHVDGQHMLSAATRAFEFFEARSDIGAEIVFDDIMNYDHAQLHGSILSMYGWVQSDESVNRRVYRRTH